MQQQRAGRIVGGIGAVCAAALWAYVLTATVLLILEPSRWKGLILVGALPVAVLATALLVVSIADLVILIRRPDTALPAQVASLHLVVALLIAWMAPDRRGLLLVAVPLAIILTQLIAVRLFQISPRAARGRAAA